MRRRVLSECPPVLIEQTKLVANNARGTIIKGSGHWLMEEATDQVIPAIVEFTK
jgi:pimeloyl-ACP methyl ester carboxylesterase